MSAIETLKEAGLRVTEVSQLMRVSRPTVSNWYRGAHDPHSLVERPLNKLVDAVKRAMEAGELPLPPTVVGSAARWDYINEVLDKHLSAPKTAAK